ncbi:MAG: hypothetical protein JRH17_15510 [Deltaproteobacteria bacterium]|nr:hypothetical protein [Deltaproteobacteria bacterium]MBW2696495.1 hypothetical protein [Deltaproteobacteria bacterium]
MHTPRKLAGACLALLCLLPGLGAGAADSAVEAEAEAGIEDEDSKLGQGMPRFHRGLDHASDFAPVGVMLDHTHEKGDWTFLYRYQHDSWQGLMSGDKSTPALALIPEAYDSVPISETVQTHLFGAMYAPHRRFTFAFLLPYQTKHVRSVGTGIAPSMESDGIGDAKLMFMLPFVQKGREKSQFNFGLTFPTGSIQEHDVTGQRLPYAMQLGSGTYDFYWGITYTGRREILSWGGQFEGIYRVGENSVGYRLGSVYASSAWIAGSLGRYVTTSARLTWRRTNNIHNADLTLDKTISPLNDNMKQGGTFIGIGPGVNILLPFFGGQRLSFEAIIPIYQNLDGPQLARELTWTAGWQWIY